MKCLIFPISLLFLLSISLQSQSQDQRANGAFSSRDKFMERIVTDSSDRAFINHKGELVLVRNGHSTFLKPAQTFGFRQGNSTYRAFTDHRKIFSLTGFYRIEKTGDLIIYSQRGTYKTAGKRFYYFSQSIDSPIYRMTRRNLKRHT